MDDLLLVTQHRHHRPHVVQRPRGRVLHPVDRLGGGAGVGPGPDLGRPGVQQDAGHVVGDGVVEVAGELLALADPDLLARPHL